MRVDSERIADLKNIGRSDNKGKAILPFTTNKKELLLEKLKINCHYKRYLGSPLRYAGGKTWAVGYVIENFPDNLKRVVSPFFGGGSIEVAISKELEIEVLGFDIFEILVNYWNYQIEEPENLFDELKKLKPNKETYIKVKEQLKNHWLGKKVLKPLKLAAYYYFNHNLSYGPGFLGWMSSVYSNEETYERLLARVRDFGRNKMSVKCASFEEVIPKYSDDFLYCDPPYYLGEDSTLFRGLYPQRNFPIHHNNFNHELLRDMLLRHKAGFILSYNDSPTIRKWYSKFKIIELNTHYTMGQGETRIGTNRIKDNRNHIKKTQELLIIKEGG